MSKPPRSIFKYIMTNFFNSFRPRQIRGNLMGEDYFGNKYYEIPASARLGKRKPERWFEPAGDKEAFDRELTAEWESWLRGRRIDVPTDEELRQNYAIMQMKKINAAKIEEKYPQLEQKVTGSSSFPVYKEYSQQAGAPKKGED